MAMELLVAVVVALLVSAQCRLLEPHEAAISMVTDEHNSLAPSRFSSVLGHSPLVSQFEDFAKRYSKIYSSKEELRFRFAIFKESLELIEETNNKNLPYTLGVNAFADMSWEEFRHTFLFESQNCSATKGNHVLSNVMAPIEKDWRDAKIVSPVKNQHSCGSCWTFSTTGALEAAHTQATGKPILLSEQQLVDCAGAFNNFGCNGGLPSQAFEYIKYNGGLDTEDTYPYEGKNGKCKFSQNSIGATIYDVVNITMGAENELIDAVGLKRPVSVAFQVVNGFKLYSGGVYTSSVCKTGPSTVNHAVLAVGYNLKGHGLPYWIVKNSWGESWGLNGYFHIELGKNMCGIATCASYPIVPEDVA